jgi:PhzF family phenazine biosynthesis protein
MKLDYLAMSDFCAALQVVGVHAFSLSEDLETMAYCRNFAPLYGINEEAATGTANGALTYYLYNRGVVKAGKLNRFLQGESMGRPSKILTNLDGTEPLKITVGGSYKILAKGEIFI